MINPNNLPTTEHVNLVYDESFTTLDMSLEDLIKHLQEYLEQIPEKDRHTAKFEYETGYYDDSATYNICYTRSLSQEEVDEANRHFEQRKLEIAAKTKANEKRTRAREMAQLRRLEKKYRNK